MKANRITKPKKDSGDHGYVLKFLTKCIELGDDTYDKAAQRIWNEGWMKKTSNTGADFKLLKLDCKRTWAKAKAQIEAGTSPQKKLKNFEKLRVAQEWVELRVVYDTFLGQYLNDGIVTNPAAEYSLYNSQADENSFIEKPHFINAFEMDRMTRANALKEWAASLPKAAGTKNIDKLASFIPAKDSEQARLFLTGWLIRTYIQAINPDELDANSIVNRWFLILHQMRQDSGKSGFFRWLSPKPEWVKESGLEDNKDGYIALGRYLFILDDELGGLTRVTQHERLKAMISTSKIDVRPPYGRVDITLDRTASFCGSTNNSDIFPSSEGTTRFLVLPLKEDLFDWRSYTRAVDRTKLWAEVRNLASSSWLEDNNAAIIAYRTTTNVEFVKEDLEGYVVARYVRATDDEDAIILRAGDIMREMCGTDYGYNNLNISRLGQALRKVFGERISGKGVGDKDVKGYRVHVLPAYEIPVTAVSEKGLQSSKREADVIPIFRAKHKRSPQR